jgi:RHS repeat-associated protein
MRTKTVALILLAASCFLLPSLSQAASVSLHYGSLQGFCTNQTDTYTWTIYATASPLTADGTYCITNESEFGCIGYVHVSNGQVTDLNGAVYAEGRGASGAGTTSVHTYHIFGHPEWGSVTITLTDLAAESCGTCAMPLCSYGAHFDVSDTLTLGPSYTKPCDQKTGGNGGCKSCNGAGPLGMAQYSVHSLMASLTIQDTPVRCQVARGPALDLSLTYNQKEARQPATFNYSNFGPKWTFNWLSYVADDPNDLTYASVYASGGGTEFYSGFNPGTQQFLPEPQTHAVLTKISSTSYEKRLPDGSKQVFTLSDGSAHYPRKIFMTQWVDPAGNAVTLNYDSSFRITSVTDASNQVSLTFSYDLSGDQFKVTKIVDSLHGATHPALFAYTNGQLTTITDTVGIQSQFGYATGTDFVNTLITPYGPTTFTTGGSGTNRWIEMTDPLGGKERVEYLDNAPGISPSETTAPSDVANTALDVANTFYFDKKYTADNCSQNGCNWVYANARITHWAKNADGSVSGIPASEKSPLESRVWYSYPGQPNSATNQVGTIGSPSRIARILDTGSTQSWQYQYNSIGKMTQSIDPAGRKMNYDYGTNNIDLLTVRQTTGGANDLLRSITYDPNHPHQISDDTDASGRITHYEYTSSHQVASVRNAKNETTTYAYGENGNPAGYLTSITSPPFSGSNAVTTFDYKLPAGQFTPADRPHVVTSSPDNYTVTTDYDALDRPITITYPDATTQQFDYRKYANGTLVPPDVMTLDVGATKDRRGRWTYREYDGNRHLTKLIEPYGTNSTRTTIYNWCTCGSLESIVDPLGRKTMFERDLQSRVITKTLAYGTSSASATAYAYENTTSRLKSMTDAKSQRMNYTYFPDNNLNQISYTDTNGQPLNPATPTVTFAYDDPGYNRVTSVMTDGIGGTITYQYYSVPSEDPSGNGATQLRLVSGPLANSGITYKYDEIGRAVSQSINGVESAVTYDSLGRPSTSDNPLGHFTRTYESDVTPRLKTLTFPTGQTSNYSYFDNSHDRRLQTLQDKTVAMANVSKFDYTYDAEGQISPTWIKQLSTSPATTMNLTYDLADQLTQVVNTTPNNPSTTLNYGYDPASNRTSDNSGTYSINGLNEITNTGYTYDANGNLTSDSVNTYQWDAANRLITIIYPGTAGRTEFTYDGLGRRVKIVEKNNAGNVIESRNFVWTGMTIAEERSDSSTVAKRFLPEGVQFPNGAVPNTKLYYSKDHLGSIRGLTNENGTILGTIDYDAFGGISRAPVPANDTSGAGPVLLSAVSRMTHGDAGTFDVNLPLSGAPGIEMRGGTSYTIVLTFDRLVLADTSTTVAAGIGTVGTATFNGNTATISLSGVADRQTITLELDNVVGVVGINSKVLVSMSVLVGDVNQSGAVTNEDIVAVQQHSGSVVDSTTFQYDTTHNGAINSADIYFTQGRESDSLYPDFAFTGHYYHARSGLYLAPYRAYNPTSGRWLARDPIGELGGINLYTYVSNDPIKGRDPLGLQAQNLPDGIGKGLAGLGRASGSAAGFAAIEKALDDCRRTPPSNGCNRKCCVITLVTKYAGGDYITVSNSFGEIYDKPCSEVAKDKRFSISSAGSEVHEAFLDW